MSSTSYTTNCFSLRTIHTLRPVSANHYPRMRHLEDDWLESDEPEDEEPDDNIIYLTKEEQSTDD